MAGSYPPKAGSEIPFGLGQVGAGFSLRCQDCTRKSQATACQGDRRPVRRDSIRYWTRTARDLRIGAFLLANAPGAVYTACGPSGSPVAARGAESFPPEVRTMSQSVTAVKPVPA